MTNFPKCPVLKNLLPGEARRVLTAHLLSIFESVPLNHRSNPMFNFADALTTIRDDEWGRKIIATCFADAEQEYDRRYPIQWNNTQIYRVGKITPEL